MRAFSGHYDGEVSLHASHDRHYSWNNARWGASSACMLQYVRRMKRSRVTRTVSVKSEDVQESMHLRERIRRTAAGPATNACIPLPARVLRRTLMISAQKRRTDTREARSSCLTTSCPPSGPASLCMSRAASSALCRSRQAMITRACILSSSVAVARPMPLLAPVIITVFPRIIST